MTDFFPSGLADTDTDTDFFKEKKMLTFCYYSTGTDCLFLDFLRWNVAEFQIQFLCFIYIHFIIWMVNIHIYEVH